MNKNLKIAIAQINFIVGDLDGNVAKIIGKFRELETADLDLLIFSELALTGYPPEDLLHKKYFIEEVSHKIEEICQITKNHKTAIIFGAPVSFSNKFEENLLYNCAIFIENGYVEHIIRKTNIPNYGVFDEKRYFKEASSLTTIEFRNFRLAVLVCEDMWSKKNAFLLNDKQLDAVIVINASPFSQWKIEKRHEIARTFITHIQKPLIYVNQVGGQDHLVFDGSSFVMKGDGEIVLKLKEFELDQAIFEVNHDEIQTDQIIADDYPNAQDLNLSRMYNCLILGVRDYLQRNNFSKVIIGMSGGIDSALCACIAVDAIGSENVKLVALPSKYSSQTSRNDALECCANLAVELESISIEEPILALEKVLKDQFQGKKPDITEENLQSRIRGNILMAISNKLGHLLLTTGNKSEMAVGYATIYGDMCGSLNPLKDVYKTEVFQLANWRNKNIPSISAYKKLPLIPENIITKAPTAELRDNQKDSDSLPEYDILDQILFQLIECEKSVQDIANSGFDESIVKKVAKLLYNSEYKRKQAVIGIKLSKMSFDKDRRYQISNKYQS